MTIWLRAVHCTQVVKPGDEMHQCPTVSQCSVLDLLEAHVLHLAVGGEARLQQAGARPACPPRQLHHLPGARQQVPGLVDLERPVAHAPLAPARHEAVTWHQAELGGRRLLRLVTEPGWRRERHEDIYLHIAHVCTWTLLSDPIIAHKNPQWCLYLSTLNCD